MMTMGYGRFSDLSPVSPVKMNKGGKENEKCAPAPAGVSALVGVALRVEGPGLWVLSGGSWCG